MPKQIKTVRKFLSLVHMDDKNPKAKSKYMSVTIKINRDGTHKFKLHTKSSLSTLVVPDRQKAKLVMKTLKSVPHKIVKSGKGAGKRATLSTAQAK